MKTSIALICVLIPLVSAIGDFEKCLTSKVTYPEEWGASEPIKITTKLVTPVQKIYIEATSPSHSIQGACPTHEICQMSVERLYRESVWSGSRSKEFDWNFLLGFAGEVFVGKGFNGSFNHEGNEGNPSHSDGNEGNPSHSDGNEGNSSLRIGMIGGKKTLPLPRVWASVRNLINCGIQHGLIQPNYIVQAKGPDCDGSLAKRFVDIVSSLSLPGNLKNTFECVN